MLGLFKTGRPDMPRTTPPSYGLGDEEYESTFEDWAKVTSQIPFKRPFKARCSRRHEEVIAFQIPKHPLFNVRFAETFNAKVRPENGLSYETLRQVAPC